MQRSLGDRDLEVCRLIVAPGIQTDLHLKILTQENFVRIADNWDYMYLLLLISNINGQSTKTHVERMTKEMNLELEEPNSAEKNSFNLGEKEL